MTAVRCLVAACAQPVPQEMIVIILSLTFYRLTAAARARDEADRFRAA